MNTPTRMLILDYALATPEINKGIADYYANAGCLVDYRQFYPNLVQADLKTYSVIALLAGRTPAFPSGMMSQNEVPVVVDFVRNGGTLILGPNLEGGEGANERHLFNRVLSNLGINIRLCNDQVQDDTNSYAATLGMRPFYRPVSGHPVSDGLPNRLAFERSTSLVVGDKVSVLLTSLDSARPWGASPVIAMVKAGKGTILVAGRYLLNATGIPLRISGEPLVHPEWLDNTAIFLQNLANYVVEVTNKDDIWTATQTLPSKSIGAVGSADFDLDRSEVRDELPDGIHIDVFAPSDASPSIPLDHYDRALANHYDNLPDERLYGWIRDEGVRACWGSTVDWGQMIKTREDIDQVADTLKEMDVNLFWGIANCQAIGGVGYNAREQAHVQQQWDWTSQALEGSNVKWFPTLDYRYFREEKTRCYGAQSQKLDAVSAMDMEFWHENWRNSMLAIAEYSVDHPCVGGITMDIELYGHPPAYNYYMGYGFEDECYFTALDHLENRVDSALLSDAAHIQLPERFNFIRRFGLLEPYFTVLSDEVSRICRSIRDDIWRINPDLLIASYVFTTPCNWFDLGLYRGFSSPERPLILMTFNVKSGQMMEHLRRRGVYAYHTSVALLGMIKQDEYETVFANARQYGHGYWINNVNSLILGDSNSIESPAQQNISFDDAVRTINETNAKVKQSTDGTDGK